MGGRGGERGQRNAPTFLPKMEIFELTSSVFCVNVFFGAILDGGAVKYPLTHSFQIKSAIVLIPFNSMTRFERAEKKRREKNL